MASTFKDLGDEVLTELRLYTEKLPITTHMLMRYLTRGMQVLQREANIVEAAVGLTRADTATRFQEPEDVLVPMTLVDSEGFELIGQAFDQLQRQAERTTTGYLDSPYPRSARVNFGSHRGINNDNTYRHWARWDGEIYLYPDLGDTALTYYYIPDVQAISPTSTQWSAWYQGGETVFENLYSTTQMSRAFLPYEQAIVNYAVMRILKSQTNPNYKVFETEFYADVERAKANRVLMYRDGVAEYYMSPDA